VRTDPFANHEDRSARRTLPRATDPGDPVSVTELRRELQRHPNSPEVHADIGNELLRRGDAPGAEVELDPARKLARPDSPLAKKLPDLIRHAELTERLPAVLRGGDVPNNVAERLEFARRTAITGRPAAAVRLFQAAFAVEPERLDDLAAAYR
jgi:hypothetical protein